ncbi:MAG: aminotransferase class V-fold PLP-dependent enzyme [Alphaproteobacteria bacterium]|nr:aminotransferase class V-fold PLP-dependent enzyme [Alphaproteobacteria bacterium]
MNKPIYLDYQASTPVDPRVYEAMIPWLTECYGNPHASGHCFGIDAQQALKHARAQIAKVLHAEENEIIFTSGATEANNLAIKGVAKFQQRHAGDKRHIITVATEHKSVLESCADLDDFEITKLPVAADGLVDVDSIRKAIRPDTLMVSVMAVNNEIGVIQPISEIGALCRQNNVYFHCDAAQAFGKMPLDVDALNVDLLSLSGHKAYAPIGVGALYVRRNPRVWLEPLFTGGGQERGLRSGTVATPLAVALGVSAEIANKEMEQEQQRIMALHNQLLQRLSQVNCQYVLNGHAQKRFAGNINISFAGIAATDLRAQLPQIACSAGSSCSSASGAASHVLQAIGSMNDALRIGIGRYTTEEDIEKLAEFLAGAVQRLEQAA